MQADPAQPISPARFTAVVLAGDRRPDDPLVRQTGACCKALVTIDGRPGQTGCQIRCRDGMVIETETGAVP